MLHPQFLIFEYLYLHHLQLSFLKLKKFHTTHKIYDNHSDNIPYAQAQHFMIAQYGFESKKDASLSSASKATVLSTYLKLLPNSFEIAPINALLCKIVATLS